MKILHIINSLTAGGAEKLLVDSVIEYHKNGIDVAILVLKKTKSPFLEELKNYPQIDIFYLSKTASVYSLLNIFRLRKYVKKYDILHVHLFPALYWVSLMKYITGYRGKIVLTEHSTNNKRRRYFLFRLIDRFIYKNYDKIIAISKLADQKLSNHLGQKFKNISYINNGVEIEKFQTAASAEDLYKDWSKDHFVLIQVSSFRYPKDQITLIQGMANLQKNIHLVLVGDGPLKLEAENLSSELGVNKNVHFLGVKNNVPQLLKSADLVILSSHYEGLSLSSIEGMASGRPFIATNVPGLKEVVQNAGVLFEYKDSNTFVKIVNDLKNDKDLYNQVALACSKRAKEYDLSTMIKNYTKLYESLI